MSLVTKAHGTLEHNFLPFLLPLLGAAVKTVATTAITSLATNAVARIVSPPPVLATAGPAEEPLPSAEDIGAFEEEEEEEDFEEPVDEEFTEPAGGAGPIGGTAPAPFEVPRITRFMRAAVLSSPAAAVPRITYGGRGLR